MSIFHRDAQVYLYDGAYAPRKKRRKSVKSNRQSRHEINRFKRLTSYYRYETDRFLSLLIEGPDAVKEVPNRYRANGAE